MADSFRSLVGRVRRSGGSVRARTTAVAVLVVGLVLLVAAVALVVALRAALTREARTAAELHAEQVVAALSSGTTPRAAAAGTDEERFVQIVDDAGNVVAAGRPVAGQPAVAALDPGDSTQIDVAFDDDRFVAVAAAAEDDQGRRLTVLAARSLDAVSESTAAVTGLLAVGLPFVLVVLAIAIWRLVGRSLAPVDAVRREVDAISAAELHRRVPQPAGSDEIARLTATMNQMLDRLERAQGEQRRFVSAASHELRSPIAAIRQHAEVAKAHPDTTTLEALADTAGAESIRLQQLVEDLLLLASADERSFRLRLRPIDLDDVVFDEARRLRSTTALHVDTTAVSAGRIVADATAARRVVRNLTDNAARHARTRMNLGLAENDGWVVLRVDDDGQGIAPEDRSRVFERFVRLDEARARDVGGAGLGLAIVAELVAAHHGEVAFEDSPMGGARVTLRFPVSAASAAER